jgi:hypothetical protein
MASSADVRPAAAPSAVPAAAQAAAGTIPALAPDGDPPVRKRRSRWRLRWPQGWRTPPGELEHAVLERVLALLEEARADLSAGWVQDGWWGRPAGDGRQLVVTGLAAGPSVPGAAQAACLVGALIRAGAAQGGDSEAGRAIDAAYDALWESRGQPADTSGRSLLRVSSPQVRQAKVQALTRWNDARGRTASDVIAILDRAIARVIQNLAASPAPAIARPARRDA